MILKEAALDALLELGSADDLESCIVLTARAEERMQHRRRPAVYQPIRTPLGLHIPLAEHLNLSTTKLLTESRPETRVTQQSDGRQHFLSMRNYQQTVDEDLQGMVVFPLLIGGKRQITLPPQLPVWPSTGGARDCFIVWQPKDYDDFAREAVLHESELLSIYHGKFTVGTMVTKYYHYDPTGHMDGFVTTFVVIQVHWYGNQQLLRLTLRGHSFYHTNIDEVIEMPHLLQQQEGTAWAHTFHRAFRGFDQHCHYWPEAAEAGHQAELQMIDDAENFARDNARLPWRELLAKVENPWQLVAIARQIEPPEFAHRRTPRKRGRAMVQQFCSQYPEHAEQLRAQWAIAERILGSSSD